MSENDIIFKVSPKYNFIYELGMPTGKKVRLSIISIIVCVFIFLIGIFAIGTIKNSTENDISLVKDIFIKVMIVAIVFFILKTIVHIVMQALQYKNITYNFYADRVEYRDMFFNQRTKIVKYDSIREIEIRKDVWERINKVGIIIIYTNAESKSRTGLVLYSIENANDVYKKIEELIYNKAAGTVNQDGDIG